MMTKVFYSPCISYNIMTQYTSDSINIFFIEIKTEV